MILIKWERFKMKPISDKDFAMMTMIEFKAGYILGYAKAKKKKVSEKLWKEIWKSAKEDFENRHKALKELIKKEKENKK